MKMRPDLAKMLANDVSRLPAASRPAKRARKSNDSKSEPVDEPWQQRFTAGKGRNRGKQLVGSDDEE